MPMLKCPWIPFPPYTKALILQPVSFHLETVIVPNAEKKERKKNEKWNGREIKYICLINWWVNSKACFLSLRNGDGAKCWEKIKKKKRKKKWKVKWKRD